MRGLGQLQLKRGYSLFWGPLAALIRPAKPRFGRRNCVDHLHQLSLCAEVDVIGETQQGGERPWLLKGDRE